MSSYVVVDFEVQDQEKLARYSSAASETLIPYGGEFIAKGPAESLHGEQALPMKLIIRFADRTSALGWYESDAYQQLIGLRNEALNSQFHLIG